MALALAREPLTPSPLVTPPPLVIRCFSLLIESPRELCYYNTEYLYDFIRRSNIVYAKSKKAGQFHKGKTSDELLEEIAVNKRKLKQGFVFAFVALIAVIALGIAWFMSNSKVTSTGTSVSAQDDRLFELASVGERQTAEASYLKMKVKKIFSVPD